jgi:putative addiction module antidote
MTTTAKVLTIASSSGIVLTKEVMGSLKVKKGDTLFITETSNGVQLSPYDVSLAQKLDVLETVTRENRDVLRKLAR